MSRGSHLVFMAFIRSGVLQGCPGSGFLFNLALDPFLKRFELALDAHSAGTLCACADDIGAALRALKFLKILNLIIVVI